MKATIDDKCQLEITISPKSGCGDAQGITIKLDLFAVFENMDDESKLKVAEALTWDVVLQEAVRRLTGDASSWAGDDITLTAETLAKMHDRCVGSPFYFWEVMGRLKEFSRDLEHRETLFWELWHDLSPPPQHYPNGEKMQTMGEVFQAWCRRVPGRSDSNISNHSDRFEKFKKDVFDLITGEAAKLAEKATVSNGQG